MLLSLDTRLPDNLPCEEGLDQSTVSGSGTDRKKQDHESFIFTLGFTVLTLKI